VEIGQTLVAKVSDGVQRIQTRTDLQRTKKTWLVKQEGEYHCSRLASHRPFSTTARRGFIYRVRQKVFIKCEFIISLHIALRCLLHSHIGF
jgi:hypothetical protein